MNTETDKLLQENDVALLFKEMRQEKLSNPNVTKEKTAFENLPDGQYIGKVYILVGTVSGNNPNHGRSKYEIRLTVAEDDQKGKMAYHHRVILPHYLANKPTEASKLTNWKDQVNKYWDKTEEILIACGVEAKGETDMQRLTLKIGENNRRKPLVNFSVKNGIPYINHLITNEESNSLFTEMTLPDGSDAPIK